MLPVVNKDVVKSPQYKKNQPE